MNALEVPVVLCDVDGVVSRFADHVFDTSRKYASGRSAHHRGEILQLCTGPVTVAAMDKLLEYVEPLIDAPGWCSTMPVDEEGRDYVFKWRHAGAHVMFVTAPLNRSPTWEFERRRWLVEKVGARPEDVIFAKEKEHVDGVVLVEDNPFMVRAWNRRRIPRGRKPALLLEREWNKHEMFALDICRGAWPAVDRTVLARIAEGGP
jgi:hypothetical protein